MELKDEIISRITIPEYFKLYINSNLDLTDYTVDDLGRRYRPGLICCPFHKEDTPSFSYDAKRGMWRCFGRCHTGGDVIRLHQVNRHLASYTEAMNSLADILHIKRTEVDFHEPVYTFNPLIAKLNSLRTQAESYAKSIDDWIELDYINTKYLPANELIADLSEYITARR